MQLLKPLSNKRAKRFELLACKPTLKNMRPVLPTLRVQNVPGVSFKTVYFEWLGVYLGMRLEK